jgi:hypothetical protein
MNNMGTNRHRKKSKTFAGRAVVSFVINDDINYRLNLLSTIHLPI